MGEDPYSGDWLGAGAPGRPPAPLSKRRIKTIGLVAAGVVAGGVLAGTIGASAATSSGTPASSTPSTESGTTKPPGNAHGSAPVRSDEKAVSAAITADLTKQALAKVPGGKVYRVETDADGDAYEAHMTKADGTEVTVKFDKNFKVTSVETGMGKGGPMKGGPGGVGGMRGMGGPHGDHDGDGPPANAEAPTQG
ncbi:MAG TPA: hypothetical protein VHZ96_05135 [Frankiaceae bacterium]|nr:hypothetical protein [Frankiaceae bacterium]